MQRKKERRKERKKEICLEEANETDEIPCRLKTWNSS